MPYLFQIVDGPGGAVLIDFHASTGAGNPGTVKTKTLGTPNLPGPVTERTIFSPPGRSGDSVVHRRHGNKEIDFAISAQATTIENMRTFMNALGARLDVGGTVKWQPEGQTNPLYIGFEPGNSFMGLYRGQDLPPFTHDVYGLPITLYCHPFFYGDVATLFNASVPGNPASAGGLAFTVTNPGSAPTPATVRVGRTAGTIRGVRLFMAPDFGDLATFIAGPLWANCEATNRNWTIALDASTTSQADAGAIGGNVARTSLASPASIIERVTLSRTAAQSVSMRGASFDVWARVKGETGKTYELGLRWLPSVFLDPPPSFTWTPSAGASFAWVRFGRIVVPDETIAVSLALRMGLGQAGVFAWDAIAVVPTGDAPGQAGAILSPGDSGNLMDAAGEAVETRPTEARVSVLNATGEHIGEATTRGPVPFTLPPGDSLVAVMYTPTETNGTPHMWSTNLADAADITITARRRDYL